MLTLTETDGTPLCQARCQPSSGSAVVVSCLLWQSIKKKITRVCAAEPQPQLQQHKHTNFTTRRLKHQFSLPRFLPHNSWSSSHDIKTRTDDYRLWQGNTHVSTNTRDCEQQVSWMETTFVLTPRNFVCWYSPRVSGSRTKTIQDWCWWRTDVVCGWSLYWNTCDGIQYKHPKLEFIPYKFERIPARDVFCIQWFTRHRLVPLNTYTQSGTTRCGAQFSLTRPYVFDDIFYMYRYMYKDMHHQIHHRFAFDGIIYLFHKSIEWYLWVSTMGWTQQRRTAPLGDVTSETAVLHRNNIVFFNINVNYFASSFAL